MYGRGKETEKVRTLVFKFSSAPGLVIEFLAQLLQQLGQARVGSRNHSAMRVVHVGALAGWRRSENPREYKASQRLSPSVCRSKIKDSLTAESQAQY